MGIAILVSLILAAGILGGSANYQMEKTNGAGYWKSVLLGLTAAATVPLFLKTVSSELTQECIDGKPTAYFVFFGFCTVAAIFSSKFLQSLGDKLLQDLKAVKEKQEELSDTTDVLVAQNSDPSAMDIPVPDLSDGSELESFKSAGSPRSAVAEVKSESLRVFSTLQTGKFAFRTAAGIAKDSGLDLGTVEIKLAELELQGKVKRTTRARDGVNVWSLK
ncbi:MAG: hypothetical protein Q7U74_01645 [Saprospiraceae bacterium]|nr:hypothetical protein [Saprospiraceae bacterium]